MMFPVIVPSVSSVAVAPGSTYAWLTKRFMVDEPVKVMTGGRSGVMASMPEFPLTPLTASDIVAAGTVRASVWPALIFTRYWMVKSSPAPTIPTAYGSSNGNALPDTKSEIRHPTVKLPHAMLKMRVEFA